MRRALTLGLALGAMLLAVPVAAGIKAVTLKELMSLTTDVVHVHVVGKSTFRNVDAELGDRAWTRLEIVGTSMRTGLAVQTEVVFLGSHDPRDGYGTSEMPTLQDTRVGNELVLFYTHLPEYMGGVKLVANLASVFRVESAFGSPVVLGKGTGSAFPVNVKIGKARALVDQAHQELLVEAAAAGQDK